MDSTKKREEREKSSGDCGIQWAPRVSQNMIRRLYETDARGIYDEDLINEVGYALYARCESFIEANEARSGRPKCRQCGSITLFAWGAQMVTCEKCGWQVPTATYFRSIKGKQLSGAEPVDAIMRDFLRDFSKTKDLRQKTLAIDRLIHCFHWCNATATRPVAVNLIKGKMSDVVRFLDRLTYGEDSTPGVQENLAEWRACIAKNNLA